MPPVEPEYLNDNSRPLAILALHSGSIALLFAAITRFIYRARNTPPSIRTRENNPKHKRVVSTFALLTILSLALTAYHALSWRYASYQNWAQERAVAVPNALWEGWYAQPSHEGLLGQKLGMKGWQLGRWSQDTDLVAEIDAVSVGTARGFWWTYQNFAGLIVWSIFVGIEGMFLNKFAPLQLELPLRLGALFVEIEH
jgi:hypothetical protein